MGPCSTQLPGLLRYLCGLDLNISILEFYALQEEQNTSYKEEQIFYSLVNTDVDVVKLLYNSCSFNVCICCNTWT